jgi:hypothetical protein
MMILMPADEKRESRGKWREQLKKPGIKARKVGEKAAKGFGKIADQLGSGGT